MMDKPASNAIAVFAGVTKSYDGAVRVVDDLNFAILRGEFLTLLGPSGSGKTTSLMMLAGFEEPSDGTIHFDGRSLADVPPYRRDFGVVFQSYALFPHMSVAENIAFPLRMRRLSQADCDRRVDRMLDMVRLGGLASRRPGQLSGGQKQRVALARALVFEPRMVLLDEPLAALDRQLRDDMQAELKALHAALGITIVHITHDQDEAMALADRIGVLKDGRLLQLGTPRQIYERPADAFVAGFVGENNRFSAVLAGHRDGRMLLRIGDGVFTHLPEQEIGLPAGTPVTVMIRPEHIAVSAAAAGGNNHVRGHVVGVSFRGEHLRIEIEVAGLGRIVARQKPGGAESLPRPGDACLVGWREDRTRVFRR